VIRSIANERGVRASRDIEALSDASIAATIDRSVAEMRALLPEIRSTFTSLAATIPIEYRNADHWSLVVAMGVLLAKIHAFNDAQTELRDSQDLRIADLERRLSAMEGR